METSSRRRRTSPLPSIIIGTKHKKLKISNLNKNSITHRLQSSSITLKLALLLIYCVSCVQSSQLSLDGFECSSAYPVQLKDLYLTCENNNNAECYFGDKALFNGVFYYTDYVKPNAYLSIDFKSGSNWNNIVEKEEIELCDDDHQVQQGQAYQNNNNNRRRRLDAAYGDDYNNAGDDGGNDDAAADDYNSAAADDGGNDDNAGDDAVADDYNAVAAADDGGNDDNAGDDAVADDYNAVAAGDDGGNDDNAGDDDVDDFYSYNGDDGNVVNYADDGYAATDDDAADDDGNNAGDDAVDDFYSYKDDDNGNNVVTYTDDVYAAADDGDDAADDYAVDDYGNDTANNGDDFYKYDGDDNAGDDYSAADDYNTNDDHNYHDDDNYEVANSTTVDSYNDDYSNNQKQTYDDDSLKEYYGMCYGNKKRHKIQFNFNLNSNGQFKDWLFTGYRFKTHIAIQDEDGGWLGHCWAVVSTSTTSSTEISSWSISNPTGMDVAIYGSAAMLGLMIAGILIFIVRRNQAKELSLSDNSLLYDAFPQPDEIERARSFFAEWRRKRDMWSNVKQNDSSSSASLSPDERSSNSSVLKKSDVHIGRVV